MNQEKDESIQKAKEKFEKSKAELYQDAKGWLGFGICLLVLFVLGHMGVLPDWMNN